MLTGDAKLWKQDYKKSFGIIFNWVGKLYVEGEKVEIYDYGSIVEGTYETNSILSYNL